MIEEDLMAFTLSRRAVLAGMVAGATLMAALPALAEDVTLTFWGSYGNGGNSAQQDALNNTLIPAFEAAHPGIKVKYVDIPYDSLLQKLTTSAAGGELPDLVRADLGWVPQFAKLGVLVPLSDTMSDFKTLADTTYPGSLSTNLYKGKYYGLPLDTNTRVLVTSQEALDKAGMSAPPASFDELKAMADKLKGTDMQVFADGGLGGWNILPWIWSGGGNITNPEITKASGYLDSPESVAAVQFLVDLYKDGQIPNLIIGNSGATGTSDGLPSANYATILDGPWMAGIWKDQYPDFTPIYAPVPAGKGGSVSVVGGEDIVLTTASKNPDAAAEFIRFTLSEQFQVEMAKTGQMTVVPAFADQQTAIAPYYATFAEQLKTAKSRLPISSSSKVDGILSTELTAAFKGDVSVQDALTKAAQQIDELLAQEN
jgi:multiple sugar transport system substrate-binding protein